MYSGRTGNRSMASIQRPRIIPTKRPLLPPRPSSQSSSVCVNPSSRSADIQIRRPVFSSLPDCSENENVSNVEKDQQERGRPVTVEYDFSRAPQLLLDTEVWSRIRMRHDQEAASRREERSSGDPEEAERRREREAEYGGLAIRGRMARRRRG